MDFYERLCTLMAKEGLSQGRLEKELDLGNGAISKWKDGKLPKTETLKLLAKKFNTSTDYLLFGVEAEYIIETAQKDVQLTKLESRIKEYALKLAELPKEKQDQIMSLIDMLGDTKGGLNQ